MILIQNLKNFLLHLENSTSAVSSFVQTQQQDIIDKNERAISIITALIGNKIIEQI